MKIGETGCTNFTAAEKQREMEATAGEERRIKVIYFLRHERGTGGGVEQPHLFCAYHDSSKDLLLKDIMRWLADLRGSHLPNAFSWSYKRRYKTGYIWQDVLDDDLVIPISRDEYVLQGCEKVALPSSDSCLHNNEPSVGNEVSCSREEIRDKYQHSLRPEFPTALQQYSLPSSDTSTLTNESVHFEDDKEHFGMSEPHNRHTSLKFGVLRKKNMQICGRITEGKAKTPVSSVSTLLFAQPPLTESKRRFSGASHKFRNLIRCGATDTDDAVLVMIDRVEKKTSLRQNFNIERSSQISRVDRSGGPRRTSNTSWSSGKGQPEPHCHPRKSFDGIEGWKRSKNQKDACEGAGMVDAYKPISMPNCSQCGKPFKPERMHKHMKSCKGMRALSRESNS